MRILMVEPGKEPYATEIEHTLEKMQEIVGGYIQAVYPWKDPVAIVCNDEGKIDGLPLNRSLRNSAGKVYDVIAGTFFIVGLSKDDFTDIPVDLMKKYKGMFQHPEVFY